MKKNSIQKIGKLLALTGALAGGARAFANPSVSDLMTLEDYAKKHGVAYDYRENGVDKGPLYVLKKGDYSLEVNRDFMTLINESDKGTYILSDTGKDGLAEAVISAEGKITEVQKGMLEMNARMGADIDSLDLNVETVGLEKVMDKNGMQKGYNERKETYVADNGKGDVLFGDFESEQDSVITGYKAANLRQSIGKFYESFVNAFKKNFGL